MNAVEAAGRLGSSRTAIAATRRTRTTTRGPCTGLDSYGAPCACPSYDVEPHPEGTT